MRATITKIILAAAAMAAYTPAYGEDGFAKGCQLYNAKNYAQAEPLFSETVQKFPKFWPAHYYLAHTWLALGKRAAARKEYESCLTSEPAPGGDVASACQKAIVSLGGTAPASASASASAVPLGDVKPGAADGKDKTESAEAPESLKDKERRWHIERLKKQCADKIAVLKEEQKQALEAATTKWVKADDGNTRKLVIPEDVEPVINEEYEGKIRKVQEESDREIAAVH